MDPAKRSFPSLVLDDYKDLSLPSLSNEEMISALKTEKSERESGLPAKINEIKERILSLCPWYSDPAEENERAYRCNFRKWSLVTLQAIPTAIFFGALALYNWNYPSVPEEITCSMGYEIGNYDCILRYHFNLSYCKPVYHGDRQLYCPTGQLAVSYDDSLQNIGFAAGGVVGTLGIPPLLTLLETKLLCWLQLKSFSTANSEAMKRADELAEELEAYSESDFKVSPSNITKLLAIDLSENARRKIIQNMNAKQLFKFKEIANPKIFADFIDNVLEPHQILFLSFVDNIEKLDLKKMKNALRELKDFMKTDPSLWDEVVDMIGGLKDKSSIDLKVVYEYLLKIGKEIGVLSGDAKIQDLKKYIDVSIIIKDGTESCAPFKISLRRLCEFDYFKATLKKWNIEESSELEIEVDNKNDFLASVQALHYLDSHTMALDMETSLALLPLADRWNLNECVEICYQYFINNYEEFEILAFFEILFKYCKNHQTDIEKLLNDKFDTALLNLEFQSLDKLIQAANQQKLSLDFESKYKELLIARVTILTRNTAILESCSKSSPFFPLLIDRYIEVLNIDMFKSLWDYAKPQGHTKLIEACVSFLRKQNSEDAAAILKQFRKQTIPIEFR